MPNYLYVMGYGERDTKIGISVAPVSRLAQLRPTGAAGVVKDWLRPAGDAQRVEAIAHRLLSTYRHQITGQRERFAVGAEAACQAVELAITLAAEARDTEREADALQDACAEAMETATAPPETAAHQRTWGYVFRPTAMEAGAEADLLTRMGVPVAGIYRDVGRRGTGLKRVLAALEAGDVLVVADHDRVDDITLLDVQQRGARHHVLAIAPG
ncbi:GIY-YIG nuclease family protein [Rhodovarius crocodyli]|nr:GIY-YIG nuclease family protein [Rhodovarius crocodyli]